MIASGLLFGWAHIVVHDGAAIALATVGGLMFAATYERRRSTLLVSIEHGLYGDFIFTVGLGASFLRRAARAHRDWTLVSKPDVYRVS